MLFESRVAAALFLCPEGGEAVVSGERCIPAGGAGEYTKILLDGEDHNDCRDKRHGLE